MVEIDPKGIAEAMVNSVDHAPSESSSALNTEDLSGAQIEALIQAVIDATASSRAALKGIRAGGVVFQKLGFNPREGYAKFKEIPIVPNDDFDEIKFVFRPKPKTDSRPS